MGHHIANRWIISAPSHNSSPCGAIVSVPQQATGSEPRKTTMLGTSQSTATPSRHTIVHVDVHEENLFVVFDQLWLPVLEEHLPGASLWGSSVSRARFQPRARLQLCVLEETLDFTHTHTQRERERERHAQTTPTRSHLSTHPHSGCERIPRP